MPVTLSDSLISDPGPVADNITSSAVPIFAPAPAPVSEDDG